MTSILRGRRRLAAAVAAASLLLAGCDTDLGSMLDDVPDLSGESPGEGTTPGEAADEGGAAPGDGADDGQVDTGGEADGADDSATEDDNDGGMAPGETDGGDGHGDHAGGANSGAGGGMAQGPRIDASDLPTGDPGSGEIRVQSAASAQYDQVREGESGSGNFRIPCRFSHMGYDDPIVYPGQPGASHLHTFFGNTGTSAASTAESLAGSGNSTCLGGIIDRSAYWIPSLLDAQGNPVAPSDSPNFSMFYYKAGWRGTTAAETRSFPQGLQMIAGDATATSPQDNAIVAWSCAGRYLGQATMPDCPGDQLHLAIHFPDCWDGSGTAWDGGAHVTYSTSGGCPDGWVAIPQITANVYWDVSDAASGGYRLASDPVGGQPGLTAHGDFFDGWMPEFVDTFVENCINPSKDCQAHLLGDGRRLY